VMAKVAAIDCHQRTGRNFCSLRRGRRLRLLRRSRVQGGDVTRWIRVAGVESRDARFATTSGASSGGEPGSFARLVGIERKGRHRRFRVVSCATRERATASRVLHGFVVGDVAPPRLNPGSNR
jgi:hypothetical protein